MGFNTGHLKVLACPSCGRGLAYTDLAHGGLLRCCRDIPVIRGIPRFVCSSENLAEFNEKNNTAITMTGPAATSRARFTYEWIMFDWGEREEANRLDFLFKFGGSLKYMVGSSLILEVGVGNGRSLKFLKDYLAPGSSLFLVDYGDHIDLVKERYGTEDMLFLQADLFALPFRPGTFDYVFSFGVLHHTRSTEEAFGTVSDMVKGGGILNMWVYKEWDCALLGAINDTIRRVTTRLSNSSLTKLAGLVGRFYKQFYQLAGIERQLGSEPLTEREMTWLAFDWLSPEFQHKHTEEEVLNWFAKRDFSGMQLSRHAVGVWAPKNLPIKEPA